MKKLMATILAVICALSFFGCATGLENGTQPINTVQENLLDTNGSVATEPSDTTNNISMPLYSTINLSYAGNKDNSITIEDKSVCSDLMAFISQADGTQGESTQGYYGAPYILTIYFEGEKEPLRFTVWDKGQYSTSKHRDNEGYEFFFNDDISDLYKYLEEKYPDEFWYGDTAADN